MDVSPAISSPVRAAPLEGSPPDPDRLARRTLARHRAWALGLLLLMAALMLLPYALPPTIAGGLLQAAAKAGFVGGLADWFAVTALFRHPLGLPIPHTAIIPAEKTRLGRALGRFVANHVFTEAEVARTLAQLDLPGIARRFLCDPTSTRPAAEALAAMLPRLLATVEDGRARRTLARIIPRVLGGAAAGRLLGRALGKIVEGGRHQEVFGFILAKLKVTLALKEDALRAAIEERVREQGGRLLGWAVGASIARRVLGQINAELERMEDDGSELRAAFDEWIRREIARIEEDPERAAEIGRAVRRVFSHETIQAWSWDVWSRLRLAMEADAAKPTGHTVAAIEAAFANFGRLLESDPGARARLQLAVEAVAARLLPAAQAQMSDFIASVEAHWDAATITDKIELRVGKDLQFVRINGTLVGFLVGGALYALLRAAFGHVSF